MFGSAKYRNYKYGCDDNIVVVHTENLPKPVVIFITSAINKKSYTGEFHYGRKFYAKDADTLNFSLPTKNGEGASSENNAVSSYISYHYCPEI